MNSKEPSSKIYEEILKTGFPLELRISNFLTEQEYHVANNLYFVDQDEGKGREIDLRALKNITFVKENKNFFVRHCFLIECKKSIKPWVIFTSAKTSYDRNVIDIDNNKGFSHLYWEKSPDYDQKFTQIHPFTSYQRRGRSFFEPFKNAEKGEAIYKALTTSAKSAIAMRDTKFAAMHGSICFYYPVIVFEGDLYEAYLENNEISLNQADSILVSFYYKSPNYQEENFSIPIVTAKAFGEFCKQMYAPLEYVASICEQDLKFFAQ